ncbi:hypothetical protein [Flagellimonas meridianipacifica]|uniref:Outer membrane protein with beta-barrel domain n=1 Tax=Flagellimonas meridianipacifica TaxID=1080225 RepID=A0A2T0M9S0_9FLAO|nr:hypothetical protein [Allomuricauda pacifica]PRX54276.1 hypothetical protein CLV81_2674 [Allomuricauda pacifica]
MRLSLIAFTLIPFFAICQETQYYQVSSKLKFNTIGFAPIPAFSFDSPIINPSINLKTNRLNLSSDIAVGFNGRPWLLNLRTKYALVKKEKYNVTFEVNPFLFFYEDVNSLSKTIIVAQRNLSFILSAETVFWKKMGFRFTYLNNQGLDPGALSGHFLSLGPFFGPLYSDKNLNILFNPDINYLSFENDTKGSFFNSFLIIDFIKLPFKIQFQAVKKLWANFDVFNFSWNAGIVWNFLNIIETKKTKP